MVGRALASAPRMNLAPDYMLTPASVWQVYMMSSARKPLLAVSRYAGAEGLGTSFRLALSADARFGLIFLTSFRFLRVCRQRVQGEPQQADVVAQLLAVRVFLHHFHDTGNEAF